MHIVCDGSLMGMWVIDGHLHITFLEGRIDTLDIFFYFGACSLDFLCALLFFAYLLDHVADIISHGKIACHFSVVANDGQKSDFVIHLAASFHQVADRWEIVDDIKVEQ